MPKLRDEERDEFLTKPGVLMRIACVRDNGSPLVTPIWFIFHDVVHAFWFLGIRVYYCCFSLCNWYLAIWAS